MQAGKLKELHPSLIERGVGPLGNLNKNYTERTTRGLPFNACVNARACRNFEVTCFNLTFSNNQSHNHELYQGVAPPGLTYLTHRWRASKIKGKSETQEGRTFMHMCVCLITLNLPLIICNLLIYPSIVC